MVGRIKIPEKYERGQEPQWLQNWEHCPALRFLERSVVEKNE